MDTPTRRSKIYKLGRRLRDQVCERLIEGEDGSTILPWLNEQPEVTARGWTISPQNLSDWRDTGYADWQRDRTRVEHTRTMGDLAYRLAKAAGTTMSEGALAAATGRLLEAMESMEGPDLLKAVGALSASRGQEIAAQGLKVKQTRLRQLEDQLALERAKFERTTAELFLKFYQDKRAAEIAEGKVGKQTKIADLVQLMFGDRPAPQPTATAAG
jgi:hypothetical protein